ncbi:hypothetical protein ACHHYP_11690 [Achlya hypogyna]|uniref:BTB domain-containing protein n=1 Tax=Achlya hypogyna TaxID=1202772 RepID=A0A1V9YIM8_ACHHY|nr:hypothetical protein ACHHYP_11690 [Achlya hypogyna]
MGDGSSLETRWAVLKAELSTESQDAFAELICDLELEMRELQMRKEAMLATEARMAAQAAVASDVVTLNVGGTKFSTARANLMRLEGSYFHAMLVSEAWKPNAQGEYFLDVDPKHFGRLMRFIRTGEFTFGGLHPGEKREFRWLLDYFQLEEPPATSWDPHHCSENLDLCKDATLVTKRVARPGWSYVMASESATRFSVKVSAMHPIDVGFTTHALMEATAAARPGWFFRCPSGLLHATVPAHNLSIKRSASFVLDKATDMVVTALWDVFQRQIRFEVNGVLLKYVLDQVPENCELYPVVWMSEQALQVELLV